MKTLLRGYRDLPVHLAISAHARRDKDENEAVRVGPAVTPSIRDTLMAYADCVINTQVIEATGYPKGIGYGRTTTVGRFDGKDRFGVLPKNMINPSFDRIVGYVDETITRDTDDEQRAGVEAMRAEPSEETASK